MANRHVLILIHGMTTSADPADHQSLYHGFLERLILAQPRLASRLDEHINGSA